MGRKKKKMKIKADESVPNRVKVKDLRDYSPEEVHKALIGDDVVTNDPLIKLICNSQAAFDFVRYSELDLSFKNAFNQLEEQHRFYRNLLRKIW